MIGVLRAGLARLGLTRVKESRVESRVKWRLPVFLRSIITGICTGAKSLKHVEKLTAEMSMAARRALKLRGRLPDTTARDTLVQADPSSIRVMLKRQTKAAHRQKALEPSGLPFGAVALDGKVTAIKASHKGYAQKQKHGGSASGTSGLIRTMTRGLLSSRVNLCIDAVPIPPETNEDGHYKTVVKGLLDWYRGVDLFRLVVSDAGSCSLGNADYVRKQHLHYLYRLNEKQPTLLAEAERLLASKEADEALLRTVEMEGGKVIRRTLFMTTEMASFLDWTHLQTVLRVVREELNTEGTVLRTGTRYFMGSLRSEALTPKQWLELVRRYWSTVENGCHQTFDIAFEEDDHPWITHDDQGMLAVLLLRRVAYNMLALFRSVTQRSDENRNTPWADLMRWTYNALIKATDKDVAELRDRGGVAAHT